MKIALIGPGILPIPPNGHGAVESLIWDYYLILQGLGHQVDIINTPNQYEIIDLVNQKNYDVAHVHYDVFYNVLPELRAKLVCISSHYPYIDQIGRHPYDGYGPVFKTMIERSYKYPIFAISQKDRETFINWGADPRYVVLMPNGVNEQKFAFSGEAEYPDKSIYLAKIENRKRQYLITHDLSVDYVGRGPMNHPNYLGECTDQAKFANLTQYANGLLLSDGENATPLASKEYMAAGLGLVTSYPAASELPDDLPWVTKVTEHDLTDKSKLSYIIAENRRVATKMRGQIRSWVIDNWSWNRLIPQYVQNLQVLFENK